MYNASFHLIFQRKRDRANGHLKEIHCTWVIHLKTLEKALKNNKHFTVGYYYELFSFPPEASAVVVYTRIFLRRILTHPYLYTKSFPCRLSLPQNLYNSERRFILSLDFFLLSLFSPILFRWSYYLIKVCGFRGIMFQECDGQGGWKFLVFLEASHEEDEKV